MLSTPMPSYTIHPLYPAFYEFMSASVIWKIFAGKKTPGDKTRPRCLSINSADSFCAPDQSVKRRNAITKGRNELGEIERVRVANPLERAKTAAAG